MGNIQIVLDYFFNYLSELFHKQITFHFLPAVETSLSKLQLMGNQTAFQRRLQVIGKFRIVGHFFKIIPVNIISINHF